MTKTITVTLVDDQDVTTRTQEYDDDTPYFEAFANAFADAIVAGIKYRSWVNQILAGIILEIFSHLDTEGTEIIDAELVASAERIIEARSSKT